MSTGAHHLLLALAVLALLSAGSRIAGRAGATGLPRALAAAAIAAALAAAESILLGFADLGSSTAALLAAAVATRLVVGARTARPAVGALEDLRRWWAGLGLGGRVAAGALAGLWLGWFWFLLRSPAIGFDGVQYHLTEVQAWIDNGRTGSVVPISHELPFGNYPLTNEVLMAWTAGLATSWVAVAAWGPASMALIGLSAEAGLRSLGVKPLLRLLAVAALVSLPIAFQQLNDANTDLPAFAWLAVTAALAAGSRENPRLLGPALVAAALAVGTKTTVALPGLVVLGAAAWTVRAGLRPHRALLLACAALGTVAGGWWYIRNLLTHGSPLWPFVSTSFGDPTPAFLDRFDSSLLHHPHRTLDGNLDAYRDKLGGGLLLLGGAVALPMLAGRGKRRLAVGAGVLTVIALVVWASAPVTGASTVPGFASVTLSTVRYMLPVLGVAVAAIALGGRGRRMAELAAAGLLVAAVAWNVSLDSDLGPAHLPPWPTLQNGILLGVAGALLLSIGLVRALALRPSGIAAVAVAAALATAGSAEDYVRHHGEFNVTFDSPLVRWFVAQPGYEDGDAEIEMARTTVGPLAGSRLRHRVRLIPADEPCPAVLRRADDGWVVLSDLALEGLVPVRGLRCFAGRTPAYRDDRFTVFTGRPTAPAR